jgi:hypothetical protein
MHVRLITQSQTHASRTRICEEAHTLSHSNGLTSTHGLKLCHMLCQLCQVPTCEGTRASQSDWTGEGMVMGKEAHTVLVVPHAAWESNPGLRGRTEHPFGYMACCKQHTRRGRRVWGCVRGFRGIRYPRQRGLFLNMATTCGGEQLASHICFRTRCMDSNPPRDLAVACFRTRVLRTSGPGKWNTGWAVHIGSGCESSSAVSSDKSTSNHPRVPLQCSTKVVVVCARVSLAPI